MKYDFKGGAPRFCSGGGLGLNVRLVHMHRRFSAIFYILAVIIVKERVLFDEYDELGFRVFSGCQKNGYDD